MVLANGDVEHKRISICSLSKFQLLALPSKESRLHCLEMSLCEESATVLATRSVHQQIVLKESECLVYIVEGLIPAVHSSGCAGSKETVVWGHQFFGKGIRTGCEESVTLKIDLVTQSCLPIKQAN